MRDDHVVDALWQLVFDLAERFADSSFTAISFDGVAEAFARGDAESGDALVIRRNVQREVTAARPDALLEDAIECPATGQACRSRQCCTSRSAHLIDYTELLSRTARDMLGVEIVGRRGHREAWSGLEAAYFMDIGDFQALIEQMYSHKDRERGSAGTFLWLMEEVGELAAAIAHNNDQKNKEEEFADVLAWVVTLANVEGVDLSAALHAKYGQGCPGCGKMVCTCEEKP